MVEQMRIQELEDALNKRLLDWGAFYLVHSETLQGNKKINGKHICFYFPSKVKINQKEIISLFEEFYGDVKSIGKVSKMTWGCSGREMNELILNLEGGYDGV